MEQLTNTDSAGNTLLALPQQAVRSSEKGIAWQIVQRMTEAGASAVGLPDGSLITCRASRQPETVLVPSQDAIRKLQRARTAAESMDIQPIVFACTNAREARSLTDDKDSCDRRYLSGVSTTDDFHAYCGGIDATISRALAYAPHADVVCYRASKLDLAEAERFASAMRAAFPDKQLGVGFSPAWHELQRGSLDHINHDKMLRKLGYDYYFFTQLGSLVFPAFPHAGLWALFDDGAEPADPGGLRESHHPLSYILPAGSRPFQQRGKVQDPQHCC